MQKPPATRFVTKLISARSRRIGWFLFHYFVHGNKKHLGFIPRCFFDSKNNFLFSKWGWQRGVATRKNAGLVGGEGDEGHGCALRYDLNLTSARAGANFFNFVSTADTSALVVEVMPTSSADWCSVPETRFASEHGILLSKTIL
jgi:hypothetical protein